jgi:hypothetical protein
MLFLKYSTEDWINMGIEEEFVMQLPAAEWKSLFGLMTRNEFIAQLRKRQQAQKLLTA